MNRPTGKTFVRPVLWAGLVAFAGDGHARQSAAAAAEDERIRSAVEEHTVKADTFSDINAIPVHLIYRACSFRPC